MAKEPGVDVGWFDHVGPGWRPLLKELHMELSSTFPRYRIVQVKEKFGTLRFYASPGGDAAASGWSEFDDIIRKYEARSASICETCGAPATLRDGRWVKTLCDACHVARQHGAFAGSHSGDWGRFTITAPTFDEAARVAARLGWWLHAWTWAEGDWAVTDNMSDGGRSTQ